MTGAARALAVLAFAITSVAIPSAAFADDPERAREYFERADVAINAGRLAEARDLLQQSLSFATRPETAFNLSAVERAMGETRAAVDLLDGLLEGRFGAIDAERRIQVEALRDEVRRDLATLELSVRGASAEVRVDGEVVRTLRSGASVTHPVDAGRHVVNATTADGRRDERTLVLARSETRRVELVFRDVVSSDADADADSTIFESGWFWLVTSVLVAGAVTTAVVLVLVDSDPCEGGDPTWGCAFP